MPDIQKRQLKFTLDNMPATKQEQFIAELVAKDKERKAMTPEELAEDNRRQHELVVKFNQLCDKMDPQQNSILKNKMKGMMPSE